MFSVHELICTDGRALNRHARKMYGFVPGKIVAVNDTKEKRHQRGYVRVRFPGLQDENDPKPIMPWARFLMPNAGGMIENKKTSTETIPVPVWVDDPKTVPWEKTTWTEEPIYAEEEIEVKKKVEPKPKQFQIDCKFTVDCPHNDGERDNGIYQGGAGEKARVKAECAKIVAEWKKVNAEHKGTRLIIDGHTSTTASRAHNKGLSQRRTKVIVELLEEAGLPENAFKKIEGHGEIYAGMIRDINKPDGENFIDNKKPGHDWARCQATAKSNDAQSYECGVCRRSDVTFTYVDAEIKWEIKKEKKGKKQIGVKKVPKTEKGTTTIPGKKLTWKEETREVVVPGPQSGTGFYSPPQIGDEVLCAFEHGQMEFPYVIGSLWNGKSSVPKPETPGDTTNPTGAPKRDPMKGDSLSGDGGKNQIGYWKSRAGNLVSLDDKNGVVRIQDKSGSSTIQLSGGKIEITQTSGNISFFAKKLIRMDCTDFEVHAKKNIWHHCDANWKTTAGKDVTKECTATWALTSGGECKYSAKTGVQIVADKMLQIVGKGGGGVKMQGLDVDLGSKDAKLDIDAKSQISMSALMKVKFGSQGGDMGIDGGMINFNALMKIKWKGGNVLLNAGGKPPGGLTLGAIAGAIIRGAQALAGAIASGAAKAASAVASAAQSAAGKAAAAIANSPLGKIAGAVAGAVKDGALAVGKAAEAVAGAAKNAAAAIAKGAAGLAQKAGEAIAGLAKGAANLAGKAVEAAKGALQNVVKGAQALAQKAGEALGKVADVAVKAGKAVADAIQKGAAKALEGALGVADEVAKAAGKAVDGLKNVAGQAGEAIKNAAGAVVDAAGKVGGAIADGAKEVAKGALKGVEAVGGAVENGGKAIKDAAADAGKKLEDQSGAAKAAQAGGAGNAPPAGQKAQDGTGQVFAGEKRDMGDLGGGAGQNAAGGGAGAGQNAGGDAARPAPIQQQQAAAPPPNAGQNPDNPMFDRWGNPKPAAQAN